MREGKEEGQREARMNSPKLNQQIKVKDARTAAPIINYGGTMGQGKGHTQRLGAAHKKSKGEVIN